MCISVKWFKVNLLFPLPFFGYFLPKVNSFEDLGFILSLYQVYFRFSSQVHVKVPRYLCRKSSVNGRILTRSFSFAKVILV